MDARSLKLLTDRSLCSVGCWWEGRVDGKKKIEVPAGSSSGDGLEVSSDRHTLSLFELIEDLPQAPAGTGTALFASI